MSSSNLVEKTLCLLVTCCVEQTRYEILKCVIDNLKSEQSTKNICIENDLIVFDNGSTYADTQDLLSKSFKNVYVADQNKGYWSAIDWVLKTPGIIDSKYEYIYVIESDNIHFALEKLKNCEQALERYEQIGSVRVQEFSVANCHLYDKKKQLRNSKRHAWFTHMNRTLDKAIDFKLLDAELDIYETELSAFVCSVNRLSVMKKVFAKLREKHEFLETDFQKFYHECYQLTSQLDGGLFASNIISMSDGKPVLTGSWNWGSSVETYHETRKDKIRQFNLVEHIVNHTKK